MRDPQPAPPVAPSFRLPKRYRLCSQARISRLFQQGDKVFTRGLTLRWLLEPASSFQRPPQAPVQVVLAVPKRVARRAVLRNRLKRLLRESWRHYWFPLGQALQAHPDYYLAVALMVGPKLLAGGSPTQEQVNRAVRRLIDELAAELPNRLPATQSALRPSSPNGGATVGANQN